MEFSVCFLGIDQAPVKLAYIDPGTGTLLLSMLIGAVSVLIYRFRNSLLKMKYSFHLNGVKEEEGFPIAVFSDDKRYWTTFKPICDEFEKRGQKVIYLTQSKDDPAFDQEYSHVKCEYIGRGQSAFAKLNFLKADIVLSTTPSLDVYQWKRSKDVKYYVHVLHAANDVTCYRMFGIDYYDAIILSGAFQIDQIRKLEKLRGLKEKELPVLGLPYLDEMKKQKNFRERVHEKKTVLLAPSWGKNGILSKYGSRMIDALLSSGYHVVIRPHPQSFVSEAEMIDELMSRYPESDQLEWNRDNDNFDVLSRSDILISDFSGVIFDFSLVFDRPIIYALDSFDDSVYDAWWLKEDLWTIKILPKLGIQLKDENIADIAVTIGECIDSDALKKTRREVREECWANCGESASLIADYLLQKQKELSENNR